MNEMYIRWGSNQQITENFRESEFYSTSTDAPEQHIFDRDLVTALQWIRSYYGVPIRITSTYRTRLHQDYLRLTVGASKNSQHLNGRAVDWQFIGPAAAKTLDRFFADLEDKTSVPYLALRGMGIKGMGMYNSFCHLDTRPITGVFVWDNRTTKKKARI